MKKWDKIIIFIVVIFILLAGICMLLLDGNSENSTVRVEVDNVVVKEIRLNDIDNEDTYSFKFGDNTGYISIEHGSVRMKEMDREICPKGICSETGWINKSYESIVCLPNKIVVSIHSGERSEIDGVSF